MKKLCFSPLMRDFLFLTIVRRSYWRSRRGGFQSLDEGFFISNSMRKSPRLLKALTGFSPLMRDFLFLTRKIKESGATRVVKFQSLDEGFFISNYADARSVFDYWSDLCFSPLMRDFLFLTEK